jgi:Rrf2 family protein
MKFTTKGRYALRILVDIAINSNNTYISIKEISERQGISTKYMETIVSMLNKGGFLVSLRGHSGGYKLSRPADNIVVGDVLSYIEGSIAPIPCLEGESNSCENARDCLTLPFWKGLDQVIRNYLYGYTIQDLVDQSRELSGDFYCI